MSRNRQCSRPTGNSIPRTFDEELEIERAWSFRFPVPEYVRACGHWRWASATSRTISPPEDEEQKRQRQALDVESKPVTCMGVPEKDYSR